jgi:hypothetical protein
MSRVLLVLVSVIAGFSACAVLEPHATDSSVVTSAKVEERPASARQIDDLLRYQGYVASLSQDELETERRASAQRFSLNSNMQHRLEYLSVLLRFTDDPTHYRTARELLEGMDSFSGLDGAYWRYYAAQMSVLFSGYLDVSDGRNELVEKNEKLLAENQMLMDELSKRDSKIATLNHQLSELKSIETSIMKRDVAEEASEQ